MVSVQQVTVPSVLPRPPRRRSRRLIAVGVAVLACVGGGAAAADQFGILPGGEAATALARPVTVTGVGTGTVELGPAPRGATKIEITLTCLTAGVFTFADGAATTCSAPAADGPPTTMYRLALVPGQHSTTITATAGAKWKVVATYVEAVQTAWGVNAHGQTFGVANDQGTPDLVAVTATGGKDGYAYAVQLQGYLPTSPADALAHQKNHQARVIPVYESDGQTVIGQFRIG